MKPQPNLVPDPHPSNRTPARRLAAAPQGRRSLPQHSCKQSVRLENAFDRLFPKTRTPDEIENCKPAADVHRLAEANSQPLARDPDLLRPYRAAGGGEHARHIFGRNE